MGKVAIGCHRENGRPPLPVVELAYEPTSLPASRLPRRKIRIGPFAPSARGCFVPSITNHLRVPVLVVRLLPPNH